MLKLLWRQARASAAIRGVSSLSGMKYATKFLTLIRLAIVARLLGPEQLGLFGLSILIISITEVFTETGINIVLLKSPKKFSQYYDIAWVLSIFRGAAMALGIFASASLISQFYAQPQLVPFLLIAALIPLVRGGINPAIVLFQQRLQFERESLLRIFLQVTDLAIGLGLVLWMQSAIGLLGGVLVSALLEVFLSYKLFPEMPSLKKALQNVGQIGELYKESKFIIGNGIVHYLSENIDDFLIGRLLGLTALGFYQTAYKLASAVTMDFAATIGQTLYPIYAQMIDQKKSVRILLVRSNLFMMGVFSLIGLPLLLLTPQIIHLIFGNEWVIISPIVRILFVAGVAKAFVTTWNPLSILADNLYHHLIMNLILMVVLVGGIFFLAPQSGLVGASLAILLAFVIVHPYAWGVLYQALKRLDHAQ